ncbi:PAS domain S-box protein [uncultured Chitinophaga sp.]|uniref:PAS domain S-box protein n=1 Tax=uncultured Chitinophaga sp. TaxID=339340 RepID=UPI0025E49CA6|nr:PAS domain S-box protein [uncultured Chitinophaga sp.]
MTIPGKSDPDTYYQNEHEWFNAIIRGQSEIIEMITRGDDLDIILSAIALLVEKNSDQQPYASILLAGPEGKSLLHGAAPSLPTSFSTLITGLPVADGHGSCGTAAFFKTPVVIEDTATDPRCALYRDVADYFGLRASWSTPLLSRKGALLGTFAIYYKTKTTPSQRDQEIVRLLSSTTILAIEYMLADAERNRLLELQQKAEQKATSAEHLSQMAAASSQVGTFFINLHSPNEIKYSDLLSVILTGEVMPSVTRDLFVKHIHPEDAHLRERAYEQASVTGKLDYEARFIWNNGTIRWVRALGGYYYDQHGTPLTFSGTVRDITDEKQREADIQALQSRFQSIFQHASLGIALTDLQGSYTLVNEAYTKIVGYSATELYGMKMVDISHPDDWARKEAMLKEFSGGSRNDFEIEKRYTHKNGQIVWVRNNVSLLHDQEGRPANIIIITEDITSQLEWKQEQQKLRKLVDNSVDLMSILGLNGKNTYLNKAGMEMLGFDTQEQVYNTPLSELHSAEDFRKVEDEVLPAIMEHGRWSGTMIVRNLKTGERFPVYNNTTRIDHPITGMPLAIGAVMRDMRPELKAQKEQQKLIALLEKSSDFVSLSDINDNVYYVNEAGRRMLGIESEEELLRHNSVYLVEGEQEKLKQDVNMQLYQQGRWSGEILYKHFKSGEPIPVYANSMMVYDEISGEPIGRATISRDLRQEKAFNKAITESEQRFRSMIEQAPVAMGVLKGYDMLVETANDELLEVWGKDRSAVGKPMLEALPEIANQGFPELITQVYETGIPHYGYETMARLVRNGVLESRYFNFIYAPFREGGEITGVQLVALEVTEQVKAKKELEASEERFRSFITAAPTPIGVYIGREMRIQTVNESILKTWDKTAADVLGKTFREAMPELEGQPFFDLLDKVYTTGVPYIANEQRVDLFVDKRMQTFYFNFIYKPLLNASGEVYGIINTAADVTEIVLAREKVREAEERLRQAIESAEMATWSIDLQTGEVNYSQRAREWYGFEGETINSQEGFNAIHEEDRERALSRMQRAIGNEWGGLYEDEYRVVGMKQNQLRTLRMSGRVIYSEAGEPMLLTGIVHDITRQKMQEQELENIVQQRTRELQLANIQLKQTNEELEQYAYVASHDLQEPLRKIRMFSSMLNDCEDLHDNQYVQKYLDKIGASAARMSLLIKDLLDFSRVNIKEKLFTSVSLDKIVSSVEQDFELLIQQKEAVITKEPLPIIEAIPLQMNQLFYNLLGNALKFTKAGEAPRVTITCVPADKELLKTYNKTPDKIWYHITITDQGIGFDSFLKEKIFVIFQRLNTREQYEGTGIGLALCRKIVLSHGGYLWAEGELGRGAQFHILLPALQ